MKMWKIRGVLHRGIRRNYLCNYQGAQAQERVKI